MQKKKIYKKLIILFGALLILVALSACGGNQNSNEQGEKSNQHEHGHDEGLVEWSGVYEMKKGTYSLTFDESEDDSMMIAFFDKEKYSGEYTTDDAHHAALHLFEEELKKETPGTSLEVNNNSAYKLTLDSQEVAYELEVAKEGVYLIFTQHLPSEFNMKIIGEDGTVLKPGEATEYIE